MTDLPTFDDLVEPGKDPRRENFPGSKPPVNRSNVIPLNDSVPIWDVDHRVVLLGPTGPKEWFTIGALATALGRKEVTIRMWETKGLMPHTPFRRPPPSNPLPGKAAKGRRLWTRAQIEGVLRIAQEEGVILRKGLPPTQRFADRVAALYSEIRTQETQTTTS